MDMTFDGQFPHWKSLERARKVSVGRAAQPKASDADHTTLWERDLDILRAWCTDEGVKVTLPEPMPDAVDATAEQCRALGHAKRLFDVCGVVVVQNAVQGQLLRDLQQQQSALLDDYLSKAQKDRAHYDSVYGKIASEGRYLVHMPNRYPFTSPDLLAGAGIADLVAFALGGSVEIGNLSSVTSLPKTPAQHWHSDTGHVFSRGVPRYTEHRAAHQHAGTDKREPTHGIISFWPLIDVERRHGPTRFACGSHVECFLGEEECERRTVEVEPTATAGSAVMFDMRIRHGGGRNQSSERRPMLYITFTRQWYHDSVNWHRRQTKGFDALSPAMKRMLTRVDHLDYIERLEAMLTEQGVDLGEVQSRYEYDPVNFIFKPHDGRSRDPISGKLHRH